MTSSMQKQGQGRHEMFGQTEAVRIDAGYLPAEVTRALDEVLQSNGYANFAPGQVPAGTWPQITYDDGSGGGKRGWRLDVLVQRQQIAAGATGGFQEDTPA